MEAITKPTWPQSWREKMDRMEIGESEPVDQRVVKSVRYIASKHFHSAKARSNKRFTVKKDPTHQGKYKVWRKEDDVRKEGGKNND
ncbi:hypothetical protein [Sphingobacterium spiritivorum]|uniref:hypothetical protein n=1 Tax=Sphingobacterium spiritivorum TaxID=258 RepID=UPI001917CC9C|nr:hypothetical protein [Sphingobacterium spiritivorum]QQT26853.1 hypothetical protein I6J02_03020 [Sphingobacterium spiritivorum]